jgi:putative ABC transport system permease protein
MSAAFFVVTTFRRSWQRHPFRALTTTVGVILGAALASMVVSIDGVVSDAVRSADGASLMRADVVVRSRSSAGFDHRLGRRLRAAAGDARTLAVLQANAQLVERRGAPTAPIALLGVSPEAPRFVPGVSRALVERRAAVGAPGLLVGERWLRANGLRVGDRIRLTTPRGASPWTVVGELPSSSPNGGAIAVGEIEVVGFAFRRGGRIDALYLQLPRDADRAAVIERLRAAAGGEAVVGLPRLAGDMNARTLAVVRSLLVVAGTIGLLSAVIVVFVCWRLLLEDERASLARLRLAGATPAQLAIGTAVLLFPATLACGVLGVPLGLLGAHLLRGLSEQLVAYTGLAATQGAADATWPAVAGIASGFVTAGIAWLAGIRAFVRIPALEAVRPPDVPAPHRARSLGVGAAGLTVLIVALGSLPLLPSRPASVGIALAVAGASACAIGVGAAIGGALAIRGGWIRLAAGRHLAADTRHVTGLVLLVGLAVTAGVTLGGVADSYSQAIGRSVASWTQADLFVRLGPPGATLRDARFPRNVRRRLARLSGVVQAGAYSSAVVDRRGRNLMLQAYDVAHARGVAKLIVYDGVRGPALWQALAQRKVAVSQSMAGLERLHVGERLSLPGADGPWRVTIAAVIDDYTSDGGAVIMSLSMLAKLTGERRMEEILLVLGSDVSRSAVTSRIRRVLSRYPSLVVLDRDEYRALATEFVKGILNVFRALAAAMFLILLLAATVIFAASLSVRRRALATSEVCGVTPWQLKAQLGLEAILTATAAWCLAAVSSGLLIPDTLRSMSGYTGFLPPVVPPWGELGLALPLAVAVSLCASAVVSRATMRNDLVELLRFE